MSNFPLNFIIPVFSLSFIARYANDDSADMTSALYYRHNANINATLISLIMYGCAWLSAHTHTQTLSPCSSQFNSFNEAANQQKEREKDKNIFDEQNRKEKFMKKIAEYYWST